MSTEFICNKLPLEKNHLQFVRKFISFNNKLHSHHSYVTDKTTLHIYHTSIEIHICESKFALIYFSLSHNSFFLSTKFIFFFFFQPNLCPQAFDKTFKRIDKDGRTQALVSNSIMSSKKCETQKKTPSEKSQCEFHA